MWIITQNKKALINSDNIIMIFVAGGLDNIIKARIASATSGGVESIILGEYKGRETCLEILEHLLVGSDATSITMPLNEEVDWWLEEVEHLATNHISNKFRR